MEQACWLEKLGVNFTKRADGTLEAIHGGGTSRKRMHYAADITAGASASAVDEGNPHPPGKGRR